MPALEERTQRAIRILDRMPKADRQVFIMRIVDGLPYRDIARMLGISVDAVQDRLAAAYDFYAYASGRDDELETPWTLLYVYDRIRRVFS